MTDYEIETETRDVEKVREKLELDAQPVNVRMVGRNVAFEYPVPKEDNNE